METFPCPGCGAPVDPEQSSEVLGYGCSKCDWWVSPVQWFPEEWQLLRKLGTGSMGEVFEGRHRVTGESAALKCVADSRAGQPAFVSRFRHEISILEPLVDPGVVRLLRAGIHNGLPYLALELVRGPSLRGRLQSEPMTSKEAVTIARQLSRALAYVHEQGVIHGDLKPENVLLDPSGQAKIADFGLSGLSGAYSTGVGPTVSGFTAAYAAPEQLRDAQRATPAADLYALGRMLFEMLTGRLPDGRESIAAARPGSGRRLDVLLSELLHPNPDARPASARDVARRLDEIAVDLDRMGFAVETRPEGAEVELDGKAAGRAPLSVPGLPEGLHRVAARAPGFHAHEEEVELVPGRTLKVRIELMPLACPRCAERSNSEEAALVHEADCAKAARETARAVRAPASPRPPVPDETADSPSDTLASLVLWMMRWVENVTPGAVVKVCAVLAGLRLLQAAAERWELGPAWTTGVVAWLALACFVFVVHHIARHPGRGR